MYSQPDPAMGELEAGPGFSMMCPRSSDPFYIVFLLYKTGHYFLNIQYEQWTLGAILTLKSVAIEPFLFSNFYWPTLSWYSVQKFEIRYESNRVYIIATDLRLQSHIYKYWIGALSYWMSNGFSHASGPALLVNIASAS